MLEASSLWPQRVPQPFGSLHVVSCGIGLTVYPVAVPLVQQAELVFASRTLWEVYAACAPQQPEVHVIAAQAVDDAKSALSAFHQGKRVVVLTSGDALFHGFGGTLARVAREFVAQGRLTEAERDALCYLPNITAFQALFHRMGLDWSEARLFSAHQGTTDLRAAAASSLAVLYGGGRSPAHILARQILALHPDAATRGAVLAENMGMPEERVYKGPLQRLAEECTGPTSFLVLLPDADPDTAPVLPLGLPEAAYERQNNLITGAEVRAVALACLRLPPWGVLWDVGAGSGSVGLEAAALCPGLRVLAVEKDRARAAMITRNATRLGVNNHEVLEGEACQVLASMATSPHRIFVGGGGARLQEVLDVCHNALHPGGRMVASAVTLESLCLLQKWKPENRVAQCAVDVSREQALGQNAHYLQAKNRITLVTWKKENADSIRTYA